MPQTVELVGNHRQRRRTAHELSNASTQTKWIMEATAQWWFEYGDDQAKLLGVPTKNILHNAALMIPRHHGQGVAIPEPGPLAKAVDTGLRRIRSSRSRVIIARERFGAWELERVARKLGMSATSTKNYLSEARHDLANVLRGMGWDVPTDQA